MSTLLGQVFAGFLEVPPRHGRRISPKPKWYVPWTYLAAFIVYVLLMALYAEVGNKKRCGCTAMASTIRYCPSHQRNFAYTHDRKYLRGNLRTELKNDD